MHLYWLLVLQTALLPIFALSYWNPGFRVDIVRPGHAYIIPLFTVCVCIDCMCRYVYAVHPAVGGVCSRILHI